MATIVQVEFPPVFAEEPVNVDFAQLYARCHESPENRSDHDGRPGYPHVESYEEAETLYLDNDGNAFVVLVGNSSCASGTSLIEASLENAPYTTYTTDFTIEPPQPSFPN